jgi:hypothetical protein
MSANLFDSLWGATEEFTMRHNRFEIVDGKICGTIEERTGPFRSEYLAVPQITKPQLKLPAYQSVFERRAIRVGVVNDTFYCQFRQDARQAFIESEFVVFTMSSMEGYSDWSMFQGFTTGFVADGPNSYTLTGDYANGMTLEARFDINDAANSLKLSFTLTNAPNKTFGEGNNFFFTVTQLVRAAITTDGSVPICTFAAGDEDFNLFDLGSGNLLYASCEGDLGQFRTEIITDIPVPEIRYIYNT